MSADIVKQEILQLAGKILTNTITDYDLVVFFERHKVVFLNERSGQPFQRQPESVYAKPTGRGIMSCSCNCGPMDEPCDQQGPGSKVDFTFKKEVQ